MNFEGRAHLGAGIQTVWDTLLDVNELADCLSGVEEVQQIDADTFDGVIRASVGPISGKFTLRAHITDRQPLRQLTVRVEGTDSVTKSTLTQTVVLSLSPLGERETELTHTATVDIKGRLALLGDMVLRATAAVMLDEFTKRLRAKVEAKTSQ